MKSTKQKFFAALASLLLCGFALNVPAQVTSGQIGSFTNLPAVFTTTNSVTASTNELSLRENTGLALMGRFASSATANVASGAWLWFSVDGTNYPAAPIQITAAGSGATYVLWQTNWSAAQLAGYARLRIQLTNANAANLTNAGVVWRRWNAPTR